MIGHVDRVVLRDRETVQPVDGRRWSALVRRVGRLFIEEPGGDRRDRAIEPGTAYVRAIGEVDVALRPEPSR